MWEVGLWPWAQVPISIEVPDSPRAVSEPPCVVSGNWTWMLQNTKTSGPSAATCKGSFTLRCFIIYMGVWSCIDKLRYWFSDISQESIHTQINLKFVNFQSTVFSCNIGFVFQGCTRDPGWFLQSVLLKWQMLRKLPLTAVCLDTWN